MEIDTLKQLVNFLGAIMLSIVLAILRALRDRQDTSKVRIFIESLLCGGITATFISFASFMDWDSSINNFIGGMVGLLGSSFIRSIARRTIVRRVGKDENPEI